MIAITCRSGSSRNLRGAQHAQFARSSTLGNDAVAVFIIVG